MMTKSAFHLSIKNTALGFESKDEYNEIMFLREITHTVNAFNDMADVVRLYSKKPEAAEQRLCINFHHNM